MSEKSSTNNPANTNVLARLRRRYIKRTYNWRMLVLLSVWFVVAYLASNFIVIALLEVLRFLQMPVGSFLRPSIIQAAVATLTFLFTIAIIVVVPYFVRGKFSTNLKTLGLERLVTWADIGLAPVTFLAYIVVTATVMAIVASLFPGFPSDQAQDVGFRAFGSSTDNIVAFMTLVVLAPVAEETLFRGYLYGKLKGYVPAVVAALVTSLLFGVAHLQWNVGIDVFILSLFLCGLRSLTGSIWAGVLVHMIKNGIAYFILFVLPIIGA